MSLHFAVYEPLTRGTSTIYEMDSDRVANYTHDKNTSIGCNSASFSFPVRLGEAEEWLVNGLARHVVIRTDGGIWVWEGFVNSVSATINGLSVQVGPVLDVTNRVRAAYQTIAWDTDPPIPSERRITDWVEDTLSQSYFFQFEGELAGGTATDAEADQLRDTYLEDHAWPTTTQEIQVGATSPLEITLECVGYGHLLGKYYYGTSATSGTTNLSDKMKLVLQAQPEALFSTDYSNLDANTFQVPHFFSGEETALTIIEQFLSYGDDDGNRYTFGFYEDRRAHYKVAPTTVRYRYRVSSNRSVVENAVTGAVIAPWLIEPGHWLEIMDVVVGPGKPLHDDHRNNPRFMFVESISFSMPHEASLQGGRYDRVSQKLAQLGLLNEAST